MQNKKIISLQTKYLHNFLVGFFGQYHKISQQIIQIILAFLFTSPQRQKHVFILKQGTLLIRFNLNSSLQSTSSGFVLSNPHEQIVSSNSEITLKQGDQIMIGNKFYQNERIRISKIWSKPPTRTEKKILTYCGKFKEFLLGKHHQTKMIDQRFLNRQFLVAHFEIDQFHKHYKNIQENDANFCSFDVLDSYMTLVTKNYIQIQVQSSEFNDRNQKLYKIIPQESDSQILNGIKLEYDSGNKKWKFEGQNLVIWKQEKIFSRKKHLLRTTDGKFDLVEGNNTKSVSQFQLIFHQQQA